MRLVPDWKRVARNAWSIRLIILACVLSAVEAAIPYLSGLIPPVWFSALDVVVTGMAALARILAQQPGSSGQVNAPGTGDGL